MAVAILLYGRFHRKSGTRDEVSGGGSAGVDCEESTMSTKLQQIHDMLQETKRILEQHNNERRCLETDARLYETNYIIEQFWRIVSE
jgi:hypothetical protein